MHSIKYITQGKKPEDASAVLIMVHGRGGSAEDILTIAQYLNTQDFCLLAPEAVNNTWYPYSFLSPVERNEPWLSSALSVLKGIVDELKGKGISEEQIYFLGFSQGACLTLEFVARNAAKYGGVAALTGGLIGEQLNTGNYKGDFKGTPVFIGTSDPDPHVPVSRVNESEQMLKQMNANVTKKIYKGMGHTISQDEINELNELIFKLK
jgi:phospholipase/carboxylesterase